MNSYKRLVDGYWAPTKVTWGVDNRTVAFRVIPGSAKSTRVEVRVARLRHQSLPRPGRVAWPPASTGIEQELKLDDAPVKGSALHGREGGAPAAHAAGGDAAARRIRRSPARSWARTFVDHFVRTREWEWRQFQDAVTDWELRRYFEVI